MMGLLNKNSKKNISISKNDFSNETGKSSSVTFVGSAEDFGNFLIKDNSLERVSGGLSWFVASIFLLADMAGGGIVAMPSAINHSCNFFY